MPPTMSVDSRTTTGLPCLESRYPAVRPAGPPPSTTTGCSRVMSAPRFGASGGVVSVMSVSGGLLIEDGAVRNAARAAVVVGSPPDGLQRAIGGQGSEDRAPLRGAPADQLRPRRLPTLRALGQGTHEEKLLTGFQTSNERSERCSRRGVLKA